jgi:hypothetical protein
VEDFAAENVVYLEIRTTPKVLLLNILLHIAYSFVRNILFLAIQLWGNGKKIPNIWLKVGENMLNIYVLILLSICNIFEGKHTCLPYNMLKS